ncbi:ATP-binding protein [Actinoplanes sp. NPDC000266]
MNDGELHRRALLAAVEAVLAQLEADPAPPPGPGPAPAPVRAEEPAALDVLRSCFGLTAFETDVLVLTAAMELEPSTPARCAKAAGDPLRPYPSFALALTALTEPHWSALTPMGPLRRWRLVELLGDGSVTGDRLRITERVLHFLVGVSYLDTAFSGLLQRIEPVPIPETYRRTARELAALDVADLVGGDARSRAEIAAAAAQENGLALYGIRAADLPGEPADRDALLRLWEREALLLPAALLIDAEPSQAPAVDAFASALAVPVVVSSDEPVAAAHRRPRRVVPGLDAGEQRQMWSEALGGLPAERLGGLVAQFSLPPHVVRAAGATARGAVSRTAASPTADGDDLVASAWQAGLDEARMGLDELGRRIEPTAGWDDLVLPAAQRRILTEIAAHVRGRDIVYDRWGFASVLRRGLGVTALFAGGSGTGKTLAAEVLAAELGLDLFIIDLSQVISKYIGETEKNLRRVFDAAERGGALLLFDEADALFGKRSEIKDSHDRYANIEVSYLLMRMEAYRGLAVLTTNMKKALDSAFLRRIRFVVDFPFPGVTERAEIWRRVIPPQVPADNLDFDRLAQLTVPGGSIRNVALSAAFLAAGDGTALGMRHVLAAARSEYLKLERSLSPAEVAGWV